jgi:predicted lipid-binding transport protein (Tim44 family)
MTGIYIGAGLLGLVAVLIGSVVWYKSFSKAQPIPKVEAPAVQESPTAPVIAAPKQAPKKATKPAAKPAITAPAMPATVETKAKKPAEPLTQFDRDLINFESKLP